MGIGIAGLTVSGCASVLALRIPGSAGDATEALLTIVPFASLLGVLSWNARRATP